MLLCLSLRLLLWPQIATKRLVRKQHRTEWGPRGTRLTVYGQSTSVNHAGASRSAYRLSIEALSSPLQRVGSLCCCVLCVVQQQGILRVHLRASDESGAEGRAVCLRRVTKRWRICTPATPHRMRGWRVFQRPRP
jgi:hypothetical protein